jgi:hypothetical protein
MMIIEEKKCRTYEANFKMPHVMGPEGYNKEK